MKTTWLFMEELEPRHCLSTAPAGIVGPFALDYIPPPGPHDHGAWQRLAARFDGWAEAAQAALDTPPQQTHGATLRDDLQRLVGQLVRHAESQQTQASHAYSIQAIDLFLHHAGAAALHGVQGDEHTVQQIDYTARSNALRSVINNAGSDSQLLSDAQDLLSQWRDSLATAVYASRDAYQATQQPGLTRPQLQAAIDALGQQAALTDSGRVAYEHLQTILARY